MSFRSLLNLRPGSVRMEGECDEEEINLSGFMNPRVSQDLGRCRP